MSDRELSSADLHFRSSDCPEIALITNHGYGGCEIPFGGAPDTGGQNVYVNTLATKLEKLGYKVTIFARGGFPHFESDAMRRGVEFHWMGQLRTSPTFPVSAVPKYLLRQESGALNIIRIIVMTR